MLIAAIVLAVLLLAGWFALYAWVPGHRYRLETLGVRYEVITDHPLPALLGSAATTIGRRVLLRAGIAAQVSAKGLAHELYHVQHTNWLRYVVDRRYAASEEVKADLYSMAMWQRYEAQARKIRLTSGGQA